MNAHWIKKILLFVPLIALLLLPQSTAAAGTNVLLETFGDNSTNTRLWGIFIIGDGPKVQEQNYRLEVFLPENSSGSVDFARREFFAGYRSSFSLRGDFDIYVDYYLVTWPDYSGVRVGLGVSGRWPYATYVERVGHSGHDIANGEVYQVHPEYYVDEFVSVSTTDHKGKLRLQRRGDWIRYYYYDRRTGTWKDIDTLRSPSGDMSILLVAWSRDKAFDDQTTLVAFDNFTIRRGSLVFP